MKNKSERSISYQIAIAFIKLSLVVVTAHIVMFAETVSRLEDDYLQRRLELQQDFVQESYQKGVDDRGILEVDKLTTAYGRLNLVPESLQTSLKSLKPGFYEIEVDEGDEEYMVMVLTALIGDSKETIYVVEDISQQEASKFDRTYWSMGYIWTTLFLLAIICLVVTLIALRIARPLRRIEHSLKTSSADDLSPLIAPANSSAEVIELVNSLNRNREKVSELLKRERAFTRYASHELRTPLTVIKGVGSLLDVSSEKEFLQRQKQRLLTAASGMNDVIDTLLNLAREERDDTLMPARLTREMVEQTFADHMVLLRGKPVSCDVELRTEPLLNAPETVVRILLSNLIRNAMGNTEQGSICVYVDAEQFRVVDSGVGLSNSSSGEAQGHGQGLLIINDICRKYNWSFDLKGNPDQVGCTATVNFRVAAA